MLRLNLGCGDKILPDYTNVDLVTERKGNKTDIQCDITRLDVFCDNSVDEILNVHVIEHFYYWELAPMLKQWMRVLKPGGIIVTETPDILHACQQILNSPYLGALPGASMSMWPLYGNPFERDPLMCHKWLFSVATLTQLFQENDFINMRQEASQYKMREPRDFRLVCEKSDGG